MFAGAGLVEGTHEAVLQCEDALLLSHRLEVGVIEAEPDADTMLVGVRLEGRFSRLSPLGVVGRIAPAGLASASAVSAAQEALEETHLT